MNTEDKNDNLLNLQEETDKRESYKKSPRAKKYVTIIAQDFYQKSNLSVEAMGTMGYLMSLPDDWVVHNNHLQKALKLGRDKLRRILKELIDKGYMKRTRLQNEKGNMIGWTTEYSDIPEFKENNRPPENPSVGKTDRREIPTYNKNKGNKLINNNKQSPATAKPKPELQIPSQEPDPNVVVALMEKLEQWAIAETLLRSWLRKYSAEYILEKIEYTQAYATKNPAGLLRRAIEHDYKLPLSKQPTPESKAHAEPVYPTHEENLAWYAGLSDEEKLALQKEAVHKHSMFEHHLSHQNVSVLDQCFTQNGLFKDMMRLIGRAK